jgi:hypothetical protein
VAGRKSADDRGDVRCSTARSISAAAVTTCGSAEAGEMRYKRGCFPTYSQVSMGNKLCGHRSKI